MKNIKNQSGKVQILFGARVEPGDNIIVRDSDEAAAIKVLSAPAKPEPQPEPQPELKHGRR